MAGVEQKANKVASPVEEEDNNMVKAIGLKEQEPKKPGEEERLEISTVQQTDDTVDMDLFNKVANSIDGQMKKFKDELRASEDAEGSNDDDVPTDKVERKGKRGRKPHTKLVGKMSFSFELPLICLRNDIDIDKVFSTRYTGGHFAHIFTITERLQNWNMEEKERSTTAKMRDTYYDHLPSKQRFRSRPEVIRFVIYGTPPSKPVSKTRKRKYVRKTTKKVKATKQDNDPGSASMASRERGKRVEGSSHPESMEIENKIGNYPMVEESKNKEN